MGRLVLKHTTISLILHKSEAGFFFFFFPSYIKFYLFIFFSIPHKVLIYKSGRNSLGNVLYTVSETF